MSGIRPPMASLTPPGRLSTATGNTAYSALAAAPNGNAKSLRWVEVPSVPKASADWLPSMATTWSP